MSLLLLISLMYVCSLQQTDNYFLARDKMIREQIIARGISNSRVIKAFYDVPRHLFVPEDEIDYAYDDRPLSIGYGQTISQPYIVAYMTDVLEIEPSDTVLEIGTGSGYQAAIISKLAKQVYTIEIIGPLAKEAGIRLKMLNFTNIEVKEGDGYKGWKEHAPFNKIIVTAAAKTVPGPLLEQLAEGGRLIIPVGPQNSTQELILYQKKNGKLISTHLLPVRFVPFTRSEDKE